MIPEYAAKKLQNLEEALGHKLADVPTGVRDQFTATLREDFGKMHIDINDPKVAEAAFAGAFVLADAVFSEPVASMRVAQFTAYLLRNLYARADGDTVSLKNLPAFKRTWRTKVVEWLFR